MFRRTVAWAAALCVGVAVTASGCSNGEEHPSAADHGEQIRRVVPGEVLRLWDSVDYRMVEFSNARALLGLPGIDLVVRGTVVDFEQGPVFDAQYEGDPLAEHHVVMNVAAEKVWRGRPSKDGNVYVLLPASNKTLDEFKQAIPVGTKVGLYLQHAPQAGDRLKISSPMAGRPDGALLWMPSPQGFLVDIGEDEVLLPLMHVRRGQGLQSQLPAE